MSKKNSFHRWPFLLEAKTSEAEARTLEFWNAVLRVNSALPKSKKCLLAFFEFLMKNQQRPWFSDFEGQPGH